MGKTSCKKGQYYCNTDKKCKPIPDGYEVREDGFLVKEGWSDKYKKSIDCDNPKGFSQKAHCAGKKKKMTEESNPRIARKKGQPAKSKKHSDLYTDEDPKGTIHGLGFKDVATAKASVAKIRKSSRSHAHKIQAAIAMEQRARVMGKTSEAAVYRKFINSMKKKTKKMNEEKHGDHEPEMIRSQLKTASRASKRIEKHSRKKENFKAWVQSKITKASDYLDTAADYLDGKDDVKEGSLHKWFKGSKSKDGKGGWVNVVTGGTCASDEPGEGTPKCVSSAKRASMSKKERLSAARRKKKADPNQQSKSGAAKPTYVSTDKPKKKKKMKEEFISLPLQLEVPQNDGEFRLGMMFRESLEQDHGMLFIFENTDYHSFHMKNTFIPLDIAFINEEGVIESIKELDPMNPIPVYPNDKIRYAVEVNRGWFAENGVVVGDILLEDTEEAEIDLTEVKDKKGKGSGKKDACYHKVKSRYSVWPSAYASGALVKCRKVGAANWGNSRKEEVEYEAKVYKTPHYRWRDEIVEHHKKDENGNTIPHDHEDELNEMDGKLMPSNPNFKGVGATKKSNPFPDGKQGAYLLKTNKAVISKRGEKLPEPPSKQKQAENKKKEQASLTKAYNKLPYHDSRGPHTIDRDDSPAGEGKYSSSTRFFRGLENKRTVKTAGKTKTEHYDWRSTLDEKCWKGYEKKGMKTMFGKRYPNCVKKTKKEELEVETPSLDEMKVKQVVPKKISGKNPANMALPKGVKSGVDYRLLAQQAELEGQIVSEKKMTKKDIKKRDEIADAISTKDMKDRYGDKNVKYAIATKMVMDKKKKKKKKKKDMNEVAIIPALMTAAKVGSKVFLAKKVLDKKKEKEKEKEEEQQNESITDNALLIQDWNKDDIKFTEIETVDVIKTKPLKESLDEGFKTRMLMKLGKGLLKKVGRVNPFTKTGAQRVTGDVIKKTTPVADDLLKVKGAFNITGKQAAQMKRSRTGLKFPVRDAVSKQISKDIQTKSIINQTKKANELASKKLTNIKSSSGKDLSKPIKVNLQKKIDFDKYIGTTTPNKVQKKFVSTKPTGTFTDDLPPVETKPLSQTQKNKIKKIQKNIDKNKKNVDKDKKNKENLKSSYDWRAQLDNDVLFRLKRIEEDWQKVNRKDKTDGLSKKAVKAYRRENPGSKLKTAVTKDPKKLKKGSKDAKRRLSFCRRMKGMKKRLTSAKTARDPDSRINKALRRWNC